MKFAVIIGLLFSSGTMLAQSSCYRGGAKACPTSGSTLLDDTYPVASYVISVSPVWLEMPQKEKVPAEFILKILKSHQYAENSPNIIVPARGPEFEKLKAALEKSVSESNGAIPASVMNKVVQADTDAYTWQQDYFESFVNPSTGRPVLRRFESYDKNSPEALTQVTSAAQSCEIAQGPGIQTDHNMFTDGGKSFGSGEMGGNVEGLPGGLCLTGDNQSAKVSNQYCGGQENVVQIDVSWLTVGHVDEVAKIVPTNRPGIPQECQFSLMVASPDKALELLAAPRAANHPLIAGPFLSDGATPAELAAFRDNRSFGRAGSNLCRMLQLAKERRNSTPGQQSPEGKAREAYYKVLEAMISTAHAEDDAPCEIETLTNKEFLDSYKGSDLEDYNKAVGRTMKANQEKILAKIKERLPQCEKHLQVIEVPDLFYGTLGYNMDGTTYVPSNGDGGSLFPNPTNSVGINNGLIFPDPQSPLFRDYLSQTLKQGGLNAEFIDTWEYAHVGDGNLHCSSHSIPYCSPAGAQGARR